MSELLASDLITPDAGEVPLLSLAEVSILKCAPIARLSFRGRKTSVADAGAAFGTALPDTPLACATAARRAALWMGPDEWTLLAPEDDLQTVFSAIEARLGDTPHALVDISDRSQAIIISGDKAAWLLNTGIFIDLSPEAFPLGTVTRTIFHKAPVMLWRTGPDTFVVEAWVSFMEYLSGLLVQAAQELEAA
ncbi:MULTISPECIES: sarcosine oxidase subunit gamma family protein [unclassified Roseibium]|uniref:sarcosine oxidase subunit gamma n=1 Tax=unclassified Roseibium TaxID=2629323 RepID=UPI0031794B1B